MSFPASRKEEYDEMEKIQKEKKTSLQMKVERAKQSIFHHISKAQGGGLNPVTPPLRTPLLRPREQDDEEEESNEEEGEEDDGARALKGSKEESEDYQGESEQNAGDDHRSDIARPSLLRFVATPPEWEREDTLDDIKQAILNGIRKLADDVTRFLRMVDEAERVRNPYLWGCYQLKKEEMTSRLGRSPGEAILFHVTSANNIPSISTNNFDWRRVWRCKFGHGVSFNGDPFYCHKWSGCGGGRRALVACRVLVGEFIQSSTRSIWETNNLADIDYDTSCGFLYSSAPPVFVKYEDNSFYPMYVGYYN